MCNLSQGIKEAGIAEGMAEVAKNMHNNGFTLEQIAVERANEEKYSIAVKMLKADKYVLEEISNLTGLTLLEVQDLQKTL